MKIYCTICGKLFVGSWLVAYHNGWVYKRVHGVEHFLCPEHADEKIEGEGGEK